MAPKPQKKEEVFHRLEMKALVEGVQTVLSELKTGLETRIRATENSATLNHEQVSQQIDALADRLGGIVRDVDTVRSDARTIRADTMEAARTIEGRIDARVADGLKSIGEFRELTAEQVEIFANTLTEMSASLEEQTAALVELADETQKEGVERGDALREDLGAQIREVADKAASEFEEIKEQVERLGQDAPSLVTKEFFEGGVTELVERVSRGLEEVHGKIGTSLAELDAQIEERTNDAIAKLAAEVATYKVATGQAFVEHGEEWEGKLQAHADRVAECFEQVISQGEDLETHDKLIADIFNKTVDHVDTKAAAIREEVAALGEQVRTHGLDGKKRYEGVTQSVRTLEESLTAQVAEVVERSDEIDKGLGDLRETATSNLDTLRTETKSTFETVIDKIEGAWNAIAESRDAWEKLTTSIDEAQTAMDGRIVDVSASADNLRESVDRVAADLKLTKEGTDLLVKSLSESVTELRDERDDDVARIDERIAAQEKTAAEQAQALREQVAVVEESVARRTEQLAETVETRSATNAEAFAQLEADLQEQIISGEQAVQRRIETAHEVLRNNLKDVIRDDLHSNIVNARSWDAEGPAYKAHQFAWHRNGFWQARIGTTQEPGTGNGWQCLVNSIWKTESVAGDDGQPTLRLHFSHGPAEDFPLGKWRPTFKSTWSRGEIYDLWDVVTRDFNRYIAVVSHPKGDPKSSDDWALLSLRGLKGRKGDAGPAARPEEISQAVTEYMEQGEGIPMRSFRGGWSYGTQYYRGDLVVNDVAVLIAKSADDGTVPPGISPDGRINKNWQVLFSFPVPAQPLAAGTPTA